MLESVPQKNMDISPDLLYKLVWVRCQCAPVQDIAPTHHKHLFSKPDAHNYIENAILLKAKN